MRNPLPESVVDESIRGLAWQWLAMRRSRVAFTRINCYAVGRVMTQDQIIAAIQTALKLRGTNPSRVAKDNGLSVNALRYILEGRPPSSRRLREVCEALDLEFYVGPRRLEQGARSDSRQLANELERLAIEARRIADSSEQEGAEMPPGAFVTTPRFEVLAAAGAGATVDGEVVKGHLAFTKKWLRDQGLMANKLAVIEVQGDSMEPTLHGGDIVLLDLREPKLRDGDIYTLRRTDELLVKRLRKQGENWLVVSDNILYPVEPLNEDVSVIGRVVWLGRTFSRA